MRFRAELPLPPAMTGPLPAASPPVGMQVFQLPTGTYSTPAALAIRGGSFSDRRDFAATAVLVTHPKGDVLIDAGFGANANAHITSLPAVRRSRHTLAATASDQLDAAGYDRTKLIGVILTHSHWDHVSGLDSLEAPIWITPQELSYARRSRGDAVFALTSQGHEIRTYGFEGPAYLGFGSSHDFYGDGSLVLVPAAGHTSGSVIAFVTVPGDKRYAFIGDLTWQMDGITQRLERPLLMRMLADSDATQVRRDLQRVIAIADRMQIVPAHDRGAYDGIPELTR